MKIKNMKYFAVTMLAAFSMTSCEDFLDRPTEDSYNTENYYGSDAACISGVNYLYNSPWYDFQRGFIKMGEVFSGNMYWGSSPYLNFSVNGTDEDLVNMSYSLWSEIGHCNTVYQSISGANASQEVKKQTMGECLAWKAMAYFYLVRAFGDVPIVHDNSTDIAAGTYNTAKKVKKEDVYEYIVMTLEKAMELLPKSNAAGRIDYYCAEGLLSKVYLTKAGVSGSLNTEDLQKAAEYAKDVIDNSGRELMANYEDIFRGSNNNSPESLFAWRWTVGAQWTSQNTLQSDLMPEGFDEHGDCWGGWQGPSADLMAAFDVVKIEENSETGKKVVTSFPSPENRVNVDIRRKATMMLAGDTYDYFWRDKGGFDILKFYYDKNYNAGAPGQFQGPCGAQNVKHAYGDNADHVAECGGSSARMAYAVATHILRLADIYLIYAESMVLQGKGSDATAVDAFNKVRGRSVSGYWNNPKTTITFDDVWKERRLELAGEGDRWFDFVRRSYYDVNACISEIQSQHRNAIWNCDATYKAYFESGTWDISEIQYDSDTTTPNITANSFILPFPTEDVALNPNLGSNAEAVNVDVRSVYSY